MRTAVWLGVLLVILLLNTAASIRVVRWELLTALQKTAWIVFVWVVPLLGSFLALQITSESGRGPPTGQSSGIGIGDSLGIGIGTYTTTGFGGGDHCGGGGHSGGGAGCGDGGGAGDGGGGH